MIFKAFTVPTPRRVRRYFEDVVFEINSETIKHSDILSEKKSMNIDNVDNSVKKLGFSIKIF